MLKKNIINYLEELKNYKCFFILNSGKIIVKEATILSIDKNQCTFKCFISTKELSSISLGTLSFVSNIKINKTYTLDIDMNVSYLTNSRYVIKGNIISYEDDNIILSIKQFLTDEE